MVGVILAAAVAATWATVAIRLGPKIGYVDVPDAGELLKTHEQPAVPLGGIGVFAAVHIGMAVEGQFEPGLFFATLLALILGLADDRVGLDPKLRLGAEVGIGAVLVFSTDTAFDEPLGAILAVIAVVVLINAVNLFDGLDGLAGASAAVTGLGLAWMAAIRGTDATLGLVLAAGLAGFLVFNWHRARVFLGDNGAYTIGVLLAYATLAVTPSGPSAAWLVALMALGVFVVDLFATVIRRRLAQRPLFAGDRSHLYDQLRDRGRSVPAVSLTAATVQAGFVLLAAALSTQDNSLLIVLAIVLIVIAVLGGLLRAGFLTDSSG